MTNFRLSFDNHRDTIMNAIHKFQSGYKFNDVCFIVERKKLYVKSIILAAFSPYMEEMLSEQNNNAVIIVIANGFSEKTIKQLIEYMYQGVVIVAPEDIKPLIDVARTYEIIGLKDLSFTHSEQPVVRLSLSHDEQHTVTHPTHPQNQKYVDQSLPNIPPSSLTVRQSVPQCPPQTISSQSFEQVRVAGVCSSPGCGAPTAASPHVTITVAPDSPVSASPEPHTIPSPRVSVTSSPAVPSTSSSASSEYHIHDHHHQVAELLTSSPATVSERNGWRNENGGTETYFMLDPVTVLSESSQCPASQDTSSQSSAHVTIRRSSACSTALPSSNGPHNPANWESSTCTSEGTVCSPSPLLNKEREEIPSPVESEVSIISSTHAADSFSRKKALMVDLTNTSSSSSECGDDIMDRVPPCADTVSPTTTSNSKSASPKKASTRGPIALHERSLRSSGVRSASSLSKRGSVPSHKASTSVVASSRKTRRRGYRGRNRKPKQPCC